MTKLRTIAVCVLLIGGGAYGVTPQLEGDRSGRRDRARPPVTAKSKAQPPLKLMSEYVVEPPDLLLVEVLEALPGRPISGERLVRPDGSISLGFYGNVHVAGLTLRRVKETIIQHLRKYLRDDQLGLVVLDGTDEAPPSSGTEQPRPEAPPRGPGPATRFEPRDTDRVFVDVTAYNSKNYYAQGEVNAPGRLPITGRERILDAINYFGGLTAEADHEQVFLYRQPPDGGAVRTLKINIDQIMLGDDLSTNYQLIPGDRLAVRRRAGERSARKDATPKPREPIAPRQSRLDENSGRRQLTQEPSSDESTGGLVETMQRFDERLSEVERKLNLVLEALKSPRR
jgi:polysaccharide biosynthesis/export protein